MKFNLNYYIGTIGILMLLLVSAEYVEAYSNPENTVAESGLNIAFLANSTSYSELTAEERNAFDWAAENYAVNLVPLDSLAQDTTLLESTDVVWWHFDKTEDLEIPTVAQNSSVVHTLQNYVQQGNGLYLSGFAPQYVVDLGIEDTAPQEIRRGNNGQPETSGDWGYYKLEPEHTIFDGLTNPFAVVSSGLEVNNNICWWTEPTTFDGQWLADTEWESGTLVLAGEYTYGDGNVIVNGAGAYEWHIPDGTNNNRNNLELFTDNILNYLAGALGTNEPPVVEDGLIASFSFDEGSGTETKEAVSQKMVQINNNFNEPEWKNGVSENALRLDGYSTWVTTSIHPDIQPSQGLTIELWTALKAYPVSRASFASNYTQPGAGYFFGVEKNGTYFFSASVGGNWFRLESDQRFPKNEWVHAAASFSSNGQMKLFLNGKEVASRSVNTDTLTADNSTNLSIGRDNHTPKTAGIFPTGVLNGLVDEVKIFNRTLSSDELYSIWRSKEPPKQPDFSIPESRFAEDPHRPRYHAMPPANWTNEPHGLVEYQDNFHLFYQRNPNGPYWAQIHWGHIMSSDLVNWQQMPIALAPVEGYESVGIWTGDAVVHDGVPTAVYTAVDGASAQISLAMSDDSLKDWNKYDNNPVISGPPSGFQDFRDPYLWKEGNTWYTIIGAGKQGGPGSLPLYKSQDLKNWDYLKPLYTGKDSEVVGDYWEVPVFEPIGNGKHVLMVNTLPKPAKLIYWIGTWENEEFTVEKGPIQLDPINRFLSPTVTRMDDGSLVGIGIIPEERAGAEQKKAGWAHAFSLPREFYLRDDGKLGVRPYSKLKTLRRDSVSYQDISITPDSDPKLENVSGRQLEIRTQIDPGSAEEVGLTILKASGGQEFTRIYYDVVDQQIRLQREQSSTNSNVARNNRGGDFELRDGEKLDLRIFIDHGMIEVFLNGRSAFGGWVYPTMDSSDNIELYVESGEATFESVKVWNLKDAIGTSVGFKGKGLGGSTKPDGIKLHQNYPNPFNPETNIAYTLEHRMPVKLNVYNVNGKKITTLVNRIQGPGTQNVRFSSSNLSSGIYFYRIKTPTGTLMRSMTYIK